MSSTSESDEQILMNDAEILMNDDEILMNSLMNDYMSKISYTFTKQDYETSMKTALMEAFRVYNMKPRGNIARMAAAVHMIVSLSGFQMFSYQNPEIYDIFPNYWFEPSDLCYSYVNWKFGRSVWIMFSFEDADLNLMKLSGIYFTDDASEVVHSTVLDLKKYASPLIECPN